MSKLTRILLAVAVPIALFGIGLLIGRQFPVHHYERFGQSPYLYDTSTGKMCSPDPHAKYDPYAKYAVSKDGLGFQIVQPESSPYPPCGK